MNWIWGVSHIIWLSISLGFFYETNPLLGGIVGYEINSIIVAFIGDIGLIIFLSFFFLCFIVIELNWNPDKLKNFISKTFNKLISYPIC